MPGTACTWMLPAVELPADHIHQGRSTARERRHIEGIVKDRVAVLLLLQLEGAVVVQGPLLSHQGSEVERAVLS